MANLQKLHITEACIITGGSCSKRSSDVENLK